jgi:hypothetical protein
LIQDIPNAQFRPRKLTEFMCREMLYEYATRTLDPVRMKAVEEFLKTNESCRSALADIKKGEEFATSMQSLELTETVFERVDSTENIISLIKKYFWWQRWPDTLRWSTIAVSISLIFAALVFFLPIQNYLPKILDINEIQIAKIDITASSGAKLDSSKAEGLVSPVVAAPKEKTTVDPSFRGPPAPDYLKDISLKRMDATTAAASPPPHSQLPIGKNSVSSQPVASSPPVAVPPPTGVLVSPAISTMISPSGGQVSSTTNLKPKSLSVSNLGISADSKADAKSAGVDGFVYRAQIRVADVSIAAEKLAAKMNDFGIKKAGAVELGWKRGNSRYYHLVVSSEREKEFMNYVRGLGPVLISRDPHVRLMPEGQVRYILWVEPKE